MELKTKYQYTYFIHPYVVKETRYIKYLAKLLKDKNCKLKIFQKQKDLKIYQYFLPKIREYLFSSFSFSNAKIKKLEELPIETRAALLANNPCIIFEYQIKQDIQGKTGEENGIFFKIQKIEIICFNTGICFICIKTNVEASDKFEDILNFNYKFRDINQEEKTLNNFDNIRLQTDSFNDVKKFQELIKEITGSNIESIKLDIDTERFFTYAYTCIDQSAWNEENKFDNIKTNFIKYTNILPLDNNANFEEEEIKTISTWKYAKLGLTKLGCCLFTSDIDINNYTKLPEEYENEYLYTYILSLYSKIYLKKINIELRTSGKIKKARKKFIEFTKNLWIQEITENEIGSIFYHKVRETLETDLVYAEVKNNYDLLYKELNIEKNRKSIVIIIMILMASLIVNILNFIALSK